MRYYGNRNELRMLIVNELWATRVAQLRQVQSVSSVYGVRRAARTVRDTGTLVNRIPLLLGATGTSSISIAKQERFRTNDNFFVV